MLNQFLRTKTLEELKARAEEPEHQLRKNLGTFDLTMFGIGAIIGAGIFSAIGTAAAGNMADGRAAAGPALVVSILLVALACGFTALAYAELASMIPVSGSAYTYAYATLGELMAWIIGWDLLLEYAVSNVAVAISWGDYARSFLEGVLHIRIPAWLATDPITALQMGAGAPALNLSGKLHLLAQARAGLADGSVFTHWELLKEAPMVFGFPVTINLMAMLITGLITWLVYVGIRESARANALMVVVKVAILVGVVAIGAQFIQTDNWKPFAPQGWKGIQAGAAIIFFAFIGFDAVSTTAEECKDPGHSLPRGILYSLGICTVIYAAVALVVTGMLKYTDLAGKADPLAYIFTQKGMTTVGGIISFGAVIATTAALLVYQVGQPRIFMSMSRDGLLGPWFGKVSPKHGTPSNATLLTGMIVALPAGLMNIDIVVELTNIGTLFAFAVVSAAVMILRRRRPEAPRRFRAPLIWCVGPAGVLACLWLAAGLPPATWIRFFVWLGLGLLIYLTYGRRKSRLREV